jgi:hypothetical protein
MGPVDDGPGTVSCQAEINLVDQFRTLQGVIGAFRSQTAMSRPAQLLINERNESLQGILIPASPAIEKLSGRNRRLRHADVPLGMLAGFEDSVTLGQESMQTGADLGGPAICCISMNRMIRKIS